jgi:hypothetical protein
MRNSKGQFVKGNTGRPKGAKDKATKEVRERFQMILDDNIGQLQNDLNKLKPNERVKLVLELAQYCLPKLKSTEMKVEDVRDKEMEPIILKIDTNGNLATE